MSAEVKHLPSVLRHHADEGMYVTDLCAKLLRQAADEIERLSTELALRNSEITSLIESKDWGIFRKGDRIYCVLF